jgi:hypothetical protein
MPVRSPLFSGDQSCVILISTGHDNGVRGTGRRPVGFCGNRSGVCKLSYHSILHSLWNLMILRALCSNQISGYAFLVDTMAILLSYLGSHILLSMEVDDRAIVDISVLYIPWVGAHESQSLITSKRFSPML